VELAMRYGEPSIDSTLQRLADQGIRQVTLAPLYPQFADSTTTTVIEAAKRAVRERGLDLQFSVLPPFFDQPRYLDALVASAKPYLEQDFDHLLLSFHGIPERHIRKLVAPLDARHDLRASSSEAVSDAVLAKCYRSQCLRSAELFAARMGLRPEQWSVSFQSRLGKDKWIEPYTDARLDELAAQGVKKLLVMCPAFVADCIETLEEIGDRGREQFLAAGGESLQLVPCVNDHPAWVEALAELCEQAPRQA
jgi:ferrochelatase